jgi:hypothetical protein
MAVTRNAPPPPRARLSPAKSPAREHALFHVLLVRRGRAIPTGRLSGCSHLFLPHLFFSPIPPPSVVDAVQALVQAIFSQAKRTVVLILDLVLSRQKATIPRIFPIFYRRHWER